MVMIDRDDGSDVIFMCAKKAKVVTDYEKGSYM